MKCAVSDEFQRGALTGEEILKLDESCTQWHSPHPLRAFVASIESVIPLLANELKNDRALTRPGIEIDQNYLLPGSGHQLAVSKRNSQGRASNRVCRSAPGSERYVRLF
jgi:hypothetical protein